MTDKPRNDLAPPDSVPAAEAKVREELAAERAARIQTERMFAVRPEPPAPAPPPEPDFFAKFKEDAALPDGQAESLARGIAQRARGIVGQMVGPELKKLNERIDQEKNAARYEASLEVMRRSNPDLDDEKIAAAIGAANREIGVKQLHLSPADHIRMVEEKARALFPGKVEKKETAETPPFVEGKSNANSAEVPGGHGQMADAEKTPEPHPLAEYYFGEGSDIPVFNHDKNLDANLRIMVDEHTAKKNDYLMDRGVRSFMPKVAGPASKRFKAKAKAAAAK